MSRGYFKNICPGVPPRYFAALVGSNVFHGPISLLTIPEKHVQSTGWFQTQLPHFANYLGVERTFQDWQFGKAFGHCGSLYFGWGPLEYFHTPERCVKKNLWKFKGQCGGFDHFFVGEKTDVLLEVSSNERNFFPVLLNEKEEEDKQ